MAAAAFSMRARLGASIAAVLDAQRDRWILWAPIAAAAGAAAWLAAPRDAPLWLTLCGLIGGGALAFVLTAWPTPRRTGLRFWSQRAGALLCGLVAALALGAGAAALCTALVAAPRVLAQTEPVRVEGWVVASEPSSTRPRVRLLVRSVEGMDAAPLYVRVSTSRAAQPTPGRFVRCLAILRPPDGPLAPGAYDFSRRAFFERLGATGFTLGPCRPLPLAPPPGRLDQWALQIAAWRSDLTAIIYDAAPGPGGALAAALVTGDRSLVDTPTNDALRDAGVGHLISVSGLHMGVAGGIVFVGFIAVLSLIAPIALRFSVRKIAAAGALIALSIYLIVSGASVPAVRAYVMACVAFGAILLDRPAISMRGLGLALFIIVLWMPESVLEPGFQMSFAATAALIAAFEVGEGLRRGPALPAPGPLIGALETLQRATAGALAISLVAGLATEPFAIFHFQRLALYGLPVNLVTAPIVSFMIAPAAVAALLLAPFGWGDEALGLMAWACDLVIGVSAAFADRPEAVRALPRPPEAAFIASVAALLWACVWRAPLRWGALAPLIAAGFLYARATPPIAAFDAEMRALYLRTNDHPRQPWTYLPLHGRSTFARDRMSDMLGIGAVRAAALATPQACGATLCDVRLGDQRVRIARTPAAWTTPCPGVSLLLTHERAPSPRLCAAPVIDADSLDRYGGAFVYAAPNGLRIVRTRGPGEARPWTINGGDGEGGD